MTSSSHRSSCVKEKISSTRTPRPPAAASHSWNRRGASAGGGPSAQAGYSALPPSASQKAAGSAPSSTVDAAPGSLNSGASAAATPAAQVRSEGDE